MSNVSDIAKIVASNLASGVLAADPLESRALTPDAKAKKAVEYYDAVLKELRTKYGTAI